MSTRKYHAILVLSDGETWESIDGQTICIITDDEMQQICNDEISCKHLNPILEIGLKDYTPIQTQEEN